MKVLQHPITKFSSTIPICPLLFQLDQPAPLTLSFETKWEVDRSSLTKIKKLGSGEFAEVWQGLWNNTTEVAIKEFKGKSG